LKQRRKIKLNGARVDVFKNIGLFVVRIIILVLVCCTFLETPVSAGSKKKGAKKYYQSHSGFTGSQASTACEKGFHMASLWEIFNTSNLQ
jgi:hypothetical protein